uniref:14-3-3 protein gamma-like n=1 Tax=Phallusia mammillata TaxID=59560 RepID=A0A6F9DXS2_9ASCI|nr:14-3-3 protein gamma-like [Phallusia mammillata]
MADVEAKKKELVNRAKLSEQAERYDDMVKIMREVAELKTKLDPDDRNLLSVAYKNVVGTRRSSWRVISSIETKESNEDNIKYAAHYREVISSEIEKICQEVVQLIDNNLLTPECDDHDSNTFYMKMKGDYYRYVAEVAPPDRKEEFATQAKDAYSKAYEICKKEMRTPHPIRLGLALNFSVFYYEIQNERKKACEIARQAFDDAIQEMDKLEANCFKDSSLIMQLLRDNLTLWTAAEEDEENAPEDEGEQEEQAAVEQTEE